MRKRERLQQVLFEELAALLRDELTDPRLVPVRLRAVQIQDDGRQANVYAAIDPLYEEDPVVVHEAQAALTSAVEFMRARLVTSMGDIPEVVLVVEPAEGTGQLNETRARS